MNPPPKNPLDAHAMAGTPSVTQRLMGLFHIVRPINGVITCLSVLLGGWLGTQTLSPNLWLAALSAALITSGGNVLNDVCGIAEDRINKPHRPLPAGRLTQQTAIVFTLFLLLLGLGMGMSLPWPAPFIALVAVIGLVLYNFWFKQVPLLGNMMVSALGGLAFLYGGFATHAYAPAQWPALFATLFHLGREILKDLEDMPGDQMLTGSTIPLSWGKRFARALITIIFCILMILTPLPALFDIYGRTYVVLICLLNLLLLYVLIRLLKTDAPHPLAHLNHVLKAGMILGLFAFFLDRL